MHIFCSLHTKNKYSTFISDIEKLCKTENELRQALADSAKLITLFLIETNCKPGYVSNGHLSSPVVTDRLKRPTQTVFSDCSENRRATDLSCSVLLRMGFT